MSAIYVILNYAAPPWSSIRCYICSVPLPPPLLYQRLPLVDRFEMAFAVSSKALSVIPGETGDIVHVDRGWREIRYKLLWSTRSECPEDLWCANAEICWAVLSELACWDTELPAVLTGFRIIHTSIADKVLNAHITSSYVLPSGKWRSAPSRVLLMPGDTKPDYSNIWIKRPRLGRRNMPLDRLYFGGSGVKWQLNHLTLKSLQMTFNGTVWFNGPSVPVQAPLCGCQIPTTALEYTTRCNGVIFAILFPTCSIVQNHLDSYEHRCVLP